MIQLNDFFLFTFRLFNITALSSNALNIVFFHQVYKAWSERADFRHRILFFPKIFGSFYNYKMMNRIEDELESQYPEAKNNSFFKSKSKGSQSAKLALFRYHRENKPIDKILPIAFLIVTKHNRFRGSPHVGLGIKTQRLGKPQRKYKLHAFVFHVLLNLTLPFQSFILALTCT